jgi:molecular chaperone Hsp33
LAHGSLRLGLAGGGNGSGAAGSPTAPPGLRWAVTDLSEVMETVRGRLDLSPVAAAALGRTLAGAALLLRMALKTPAQLIVEVSGDGPLGRVVAEADAAGHLRGMVGNRLAAVPHTTEGKLDVGRAVGQGHLRVLRRYSQGGSYDSQVELVTGEIGDDLAHFLQQSEQTRSAVLLGVLARPTGVAAAGGMIIEALPGADEATLSTLETNLARLGGVSRVLEAGGLQAVLEAALAGLEVVELERRPLAYHCRCGRQRLRRHLALLPDDDLASLQRDDGSVGAECVFCGTEYRFQADELR